ncbi:FAD-dependent monooxygenase [Nocardioides sp. CPCC 205120]|uniref:FAD-dependent monooxygenase n=1 Tax=Nocardioides sp. CPCC 205120 TaxID=3406462 RepID=UPI003B504191
MDLRSVAVLGGGPGGLYVARLLKLRWPDCDVRVHEQSPPATTFGFGVGLATRTQRNLSAADPATFDDIVARSHPHDMAMAVGDSRVQLSVGNLIAIGRSTLLEVLRDHALAAGVRIEHGRRVDVEELRSDPAVDLVVAADGIGSTVRERYAAELGARVTTHDNLYLWAGTEQALPSAVFRPVETPVGTFVAHAYPYAADRSTFLVETDAATWRRAGFDATTGRTPLDASDEESLAFLSKVFDDDLDGRPLVGNRTRWLRFRTVRCARWHLDDLVVLGDAAHTAHYSIGSGTKLAMEDGIALVAALAEHASVAAALTAYDERRRPAVEHLQDTAERSMRWWDAFPERLDLPVERLLVAYMTRAGKVDLQRFAALAPAVARAGLEQYAGVAPTGVPDARLDDWVLEQPLRRDPVRLPGRLVDAPAAAGLDPWVLSAVPDAWGAGGDAAVAAASGAAAAGRAVAVEPAPGTGTRSAALDVCELAERVRREAGALTVVRVAPADRSVAAAALASGRADLVELVPEG